MRTSCDAASASGAPNARRRSKEEFGAGGAGAIGVWTVSIQQKSVTTSSSAMPSSEDKYQHTNETQRYEAADLRRAFGHSNKQAGGLTRQSSRTARRGRSLRFVGKPKEDRKNPYTSLVPAFAARNHNTQDPDSTLSFPEFLAASMTSAL